jgi:hypothetical protein
MDWKAIVKTVAPGLATALGGPLAGLAVTAIGEALGVSEPTQEKLQQAIAGAKPEDLLKLKVADQEFAKSMKALDVDLERIAAGDRDSARGMQKETKSTIPGALAILVTLGFFGVLGYLLVAGKPQQGGDALLIMLGALGASFGAVVQFYFGSSASSQSKDGMLAKARL